VTSLDFTNTVYYMSLLSLHLDRNTQCSMNNDVIPTNAQYLLNTAY
jgi:hypothetical protein